MEECKIFGYVVRVKGSSYGGTGNSLPAKSFITVNGITMMQTSRSVIARERRK